MKYLGDALKTVAARGLTNKQTNKQTNRQTDKQNNQHTSENRVFESNEITQRVTTFENLHLSSEKNAH